MLSTVILQSIIKKEKELEDTMSRMFLSKKLADETDDLKERDSYISEYKHYGTILLEIQSNIDSLKSSKHFDKKLDRDRIFLDELEEE